MLEGEKPQPLEPSLFLSTFLKQVLSLQSWLGFSFESTEAFVVSTPPTGEKAAGEVTWFPLPSSSLALQRKTGCAGLWEGCSP